jgi:hypothetical protein
MKRSIESFPNYNIITLIYLCKEMLWIETQIKMNLALNLMN